MSTRIDADHFRQLNRAGRWLGFERRGVEVDPGGALHLFSLPRLQGGHADLTQLPAPPLPLGVAVDGAGNTYWWDPRAGRLMRRLACGGESAALACVGRHASGPGRVDAPVALLAPPHRDALYIADAAGHRIVIVDPHGGQVLEVWGGDGTLHTPWSMAADGEGHVYVVERGARLRRLDPLGVPVPGFEARLQQAHPGLQPLGVAVSPGDPQTVYLLDGAGGRVLALDSGGEPLRAPGGAPLAFGGGVLQDPALLAADGDSVYVADHATRRVHVFKRHAGHAHAGSAIGFSGAAAGMALDPGGLLVLHAGADDGLLRLDIAGGHTTRGLAWTAEAVVAGHVKTLWHRLAAQVARSGHNAHLQLFVAQQPAPPPVDPHGDDPFPAPRWRSAGVDVDQMFIGGDPGPHLWVGVRFFGDGTDSARLSGLRAEHDVETCLEFLPAVYRGSACDDFLLRFTALFQGFFGELDTALDRTPAISDPAATAPGRLPWLAGWLDVELDEAWPEAAQREFIAGAYRRHGRRGTAWGLEEALRTRAGVRAVIEEPVLHARVWTLPGEESCREPLGRCDFAPQQDASVLGFSTMLAPAEAQGAVVGTSAVVDRSHLIDNERIGWPLFEDVAYQFSVQVPGDALRCEATRQRVREVLDQERPAHTDYHLCVIAPRMRVGFQARLGIDTLVAGIAPTPLDGDGGALVLGGPAAGELGRTRVGVSTSL